LGGLIRGGRAARFRRRPWLPVVLVASGLVASCALRTSGDWLSRVHAGHPLVGSIWDAAAQRAIGEAQLIERLAAHELLLLGEKHDNPDHHRLQARILNALVERGRRPAVAFEMLSVDVAPALAEALADSPVTPDELRAAVRWDESHGLAWSLYAPVFETALRARLPIFAADLPKRWLDSLREEGALGLERDGVERLALDEPLPPQTHRAFAEEIRTAHCDHAPEGQLEKMIDIQRARDAQLARVLLEAASAGGDGAVLIAGTGHARTDRGVPVYLKRWSASARVASVGLREVSGERLDARGELERAFGADVPFDYVWFTPRVDDLDPCEKFKRDLEKIAPAGSDDSAS
jgi:uncharacterized iron-regulated protein